VTATDKVPPPPSTRIVVRLTPAEWEAAFAIGMKRQEYREKKGKQVEQFRDNGGTNDYRNGIGSVAEYALAKHYGPDVLKDWCEHKSYAEGQAIARIHADVGSNVQVRAVDRMHKSIILHPKDYSDAPFVLAVTDERNHTVTYVGWNYARNLKLAEYWDNKTKGFDQPGRAAFRVPQKELLPMDTLPPEEIRDENFGL
jgi:hypothetical protein